MKYLIASFLVLQAFSACSTTGSTASPEQKKCDSSKKINKDTENAPALTDQQIIDAMNEAAIPGEEHAVLKPLIGEFTTTSRFWYDTKSEPEIVKGHARHYSILGGRYIREDFTSTWQKKPYNGIGHLGYDKTKKKYFSVWMDTSSTGMMSSEGSYDKDSKTLTFNTTYTCPVEGVDKAGKTIMRIIDKDNFVYEMYDLRKDGSEMKMMEIKYKRKK